MSDPMPAKAERPLTAAEWSSLSAGLAQALRAAEVEPVVVARPSLPARLAGLMRPVTPVMVLGRRIFWPGALEDFSGPWDGRAMAVLQHELQHVLEFATGELSVARYVLWPLNWRYGYELGPGSQWKDFGAEQRASIAEHLWLIEHGLRADPEGGALHRRVIPWAQSSS
jgi:hypothetical protein